VCKILSSLKAAKDPSDSKSYRPISLLCPAIKILERLLPYILAYKSQNVRPNLDQKVGRATYTRVMADSPGETGSHFVNGPCLLDYLILKLRLPVVLYVSFAVDS